MAVGSLGSFYVPGSLYKRHPAPYSSGMLYKRFEATQAQMINRRAIEGLSREISAAASTIFAQTTSRSEGLSVLAAQRFRDRAIAELQAARDATLGGANSTLTLKV